MYSKYQISKILVDSASYALNGNGGGNVNTSSFITNAQTSSMSVLSASYAVTASHALNAGNSPSINTSSFITNSQTSSMSVLSASYATTASYIQWRPVTSGLKSTDYTCIMNDYIVLTDSDSGPGNFSIYLYPNPTDGQELIIKDTGFGTNIITIDGNGKYIDYSPIFALGAGFIQSHFTRCHMVFSAEKDWWLLIEGITGF